MPTLVEHLQETQEWRSVVGKAIVCFGEIELVTYQCLAHIPSDKISDTSSKLGFSRRVDLIVEILEGRPPIPSPVSKFIAMLQHAKQLANVFHVKTSCWLIEDIQRTARRAS